MNRLDIILGCMYGGKTTELLRQLLISSELGLKVLYINHSIDTRSMNVFSTHHPYIVPKEHHNIDFISLSSLKGVRKEEYDVIGIDEAQFFDISLIEFCKIHVETYKRHVIVCGLDSTFRREKFGYILDLIPLCDSIVKLKPYCADCSTKKVEALFSHLFYQSSDSTNTIIGGREKYKPLCRNCYLKSNP